MRSAASGNSSVPLPSFPKFEDGTVRSKWVKEYDRVEAELLKKHLEPSETPPPSGKSSNHTNQTQQQQQQTAAGSGKTVVLSLRHMESNWSREPPTEPLKDPAPVRRKKQNEPFLRAGSRSDRRADNNNDGDKSDNFSSNKFKGRKDDDNDASEWLLEAANARSSAVGALADPSSYQRSPTRSRPNAAADGSNDHLHPSPVRSSSSSTGITKSSSSNPYDLNRWTRVLDAIVHPPVRYQASLNVLGSEGWELNWMKNIGRTDRIPSLLTLETLKDSIYEQPKDIALNSPRSILVMLKNGLAVSDLKPRTKDSFVNNDLPVKEQAIAYTHHEQRRKAVIQSLKSEYRNMCSNLTLHDLIEGLITLREAREHARLHPQTPPAAMQPWSKSRTRTRSTSPPPNAAARLRASAATPQPYNNNTDILSGGATNNNKHVTMMADPSTTIERPHSSLAGPISSSLRGFDLESQFRRAEIKKQKEQEIEDRKRQQEDHARLVALRRQSTMEKIKEHNEQMQMKAEERQRILDDHVKQVEKKRLLERKKIAEREKQRSQHRAVILAQARQQEQERKERILMRMRREEQILERSREQKEKQHRTETAIRHQQNADRLFLGTRHRRAAEFQKLFTISEIEDKADRAEHASVSRRWGVGGRSSTSPDRDYH